MDIHALMEAEADVEDAQGAWVFALTWEKLEKAFEDGEYDSDEDYVELADYEVARAKLGLKHGLFQQKSVVMVKAESSAAPARFHGLRVAAGGSESRRDD